MSSVSIVIPCFNARHWIRATLESVFDQRSLDLQVIVVDDGSTDGSGDLVSQWFPNVELVRMDNGGPSRARNMGTRLARGQFIQYLDVDDLLAPDKLEGQVQALTASGADIAYGDWREFQSGPDTPCVPGRLVARRIEGHPEIALCTNFWCPPAAYLFRRSIVDDVGGWDEQQAVVEDVRFVLQCALRGAAFVYCPGVAALYRTHTTDSQSTRDPTAFNRGCLRNAAMLEDWWRRRAALTPTRVEALLKAYGYVARATFECDASTFEAAYAAMDRLHPGYIPRHPWHLSLTSRLVGYRSAEAIGVRYRRTKQTFTQVVRTVRQ